MKTSMVVKLVAAPGKSGELEQFLTDAVEMANAEEFMPVWLSVKQDERTFYILDAFPSQDGPQKHLDGEIAAKLMANKDTLLAEDPEINICEVLASKLPS